ncbi:MAG: Asparagine synthetase [Gemmatimonadetes bacterium]|nr:Asparagine synthetase [Gemmatimonadota bacterium]
MFSSAGATARLRRCNSRMCGICGIFTHEHLNSSHLDELTALVGLMRRRGPDDQGAWTDDAHAALGFRRLAIIDPTPAGHQPMLSAGGRYALVFNGELYNYRELREELLSKGCQFRSTSDTEVVLQALGEWGVDALRRFNGMFAIGFYDSEECELLLARDAIGVKPLYFFDDGRTLVFGSQYDQVIRHRWCDRAAISDEALGLYLALGHVPAPFGIVRGTSQVEPGEWVTIRPGGRVARGRFYSLPISGAGADREARAALPDALQQAVRRQMVSDVPIGAFLSGGVDSPLVAALMTRATSEPVRAFTIGSPDEALDESESARAYASALGLQHTVRTFSAEAALSLVDSVSHAYSEPFADPSAFPTMLVSSVAREQVAVALSGDGGDELFWGYPRFRKLLAARSLFERSRSERYLRYVAGRAGMGPKLPGGVLEASLGDWYLHAHSAITQRELSRLAPSLPPAQATLSWYRLETAPRDDLVFAHWMRENEIRGHLQMLLLKVDRASMFYSLEVRVPLLDQELVGLAMQLSPTSCIGPTEGKLPLRQALAQFVPATQIPNGKRGFDVPIASWLRRELRPLVHELLFDRQGTFMAALDSREVRRLVDQHNGGLDRHRALWNLMALQLWDRDHRSVGTAPVPDGPPLFIER